MPPTTRPPRTSGAPPGVGSAWPSRIAGTVRQNAEPLLASSPSSVVDFLNAAAATAFAREVSGVKKPVPSPRALSTRRPGLVHHRDRHRRAERPRLGLGRAHRLLRQL